MFGEKVNVLLHFSCFVRLVSTAYIICYEGSFSKYTKVPIETPEILINSSSPCIDVSKKTVVFVFGFQGSPTGPAVSTIMPTFIEQGTNVLLVDWMMEASGGILGPLGYPLQALPETKIIGAKFGRALATLIRLGMSKDIHIVGHSLGAQLSGYAGTEAQKEGLTIPWITALDPARIGYDTPAYPAVNATCAEFVDVVHCDPGGYGMNKSTGHVDLWPDYGQFVAGNRLLPGCFKKATPMDLVVRGNSCNHDRCIFLYNISLTMPEAFQASGAKDYFSWTEQAEETNRIFLGPLVDKQKRGNFYFSTTSAYPWSKGENGTRP